MTGECTIGSYKLGRTLGVGTFGKVKLAVHEGTDLNVAVKIINKVKMEQIDMHGKIQREIAILQCLHHPHVIRLYELIDTPTDIFMVMEYVPGGELFDYIIQRTRLQEPEARRFFQQIVSGVEYCHHNGVCHRDLKPENVLLDSNLNVKVGDFGLSNFMRDGDFLRTSCGSPNYASPEVVSGKPYAGPEVDVWSCAVILYALLCGSLPFDDEHVPNLFKKIKHGTFTLPGHLSEQSRNLISRMLVVDPVKRITFKEIRRHPWFRTNLSPLLSSSTLLRMYTNTGVDISIIEEMKSLGYTVDPKVLLKSFSGAGKTTSRERVTYQLLSDRKATHRFASYGDNAGFRILPFSFSRDIQKEVAAASVIMDPEVCPLQWMSENIFTLNSSTAAYTAKSMADHLSGGASIQKGGFMSWLSRPPYINTSTTLDWSPGNPTWGTSRWKLGIESSLESAIIVTAILNTLKALNYEWRLITPFKIRCRAIKQDYMDDNKNFSDSEKYATNNGSVENKLEKNTSLSEDNKASALEEENFTSNSSSDNKDCRHDQVNNNLLNENAETVVAQENNTQHTDNQVSLSSQSAIICIQLYKISAARYLIDFQLFDGPTLTSFGESLWLTSAIYSALTQIQLQDSPGANTLINQSHQRPYF